MTQITLSQIFFKHLHHLLYRITSTLGLLQVLYINIFVKISYKNSENNTV